MGYPKIELPRNGQYIHLNEPKICRDEITNTIKMESKISTQFCNMTEKNIIDNAIAYARANNVVDLILIDEKFVRNALKHEAERQQKPKTNFDRITESVEAFADWIFKSYTNVPENVPCAVENCETTNRMDCKKCFIKWLQKEADDGI